MDPFLHPYLEMLQRHTSKIQVPGLKRNYSIALVEIFIQPDLAVPSSSDNNAPEADEQKTRKGWRKQEKQQEQKSIPQTVFEPALSVLSKENQIVVLGEPGQGKSTLLRQYAFEVAALKSELPIFVELGEKREWTGTLAGEYTWIKERIPAAPRDRLGDAAWRMCCRALNEGRATLILDGLDELSEEARRQVMNLLETLKGNRLIISSRPQAYSPLSGFKAYKLAQLRSEQVDSLAANFCRAMAKERDLQDHTPALNKVLDTARGNAWAMVRNPLLLYFICLAAFSDESIPNRPAPLIDKCITELVRWEQRRPGSVWPKPEEFDAENVVLILGKLALRSFSQTTGIITESEVKEVLSDKQDRSRFRKLLVPAGFIGEVENGYKFILDTFREYYAARAVAADPDPFGRVRLQLHRPEWQRVVLLTAGSLKDEKARWLHLRFPVLTATLVKVFGPVIRVGSGLIGLAPVPQAVADVGRAGLEEAASAIRGPLEKWLQRSRHSTEFFISAIWKHHCRWRWQRYERVLWRDARLASRCLAEIEAGPHRMVAPLADFVLFGSRNGWRVAFSEERLIAVQNPQVRRRWLNQTMAKKTRGVATEVLAQAVSDTEVRNGLLELTRDKNEWICREAVEALRPASTMPEVQERLLGFVAEEHSKYLVRDVISILITPPANPDVLKRLLKLVRDLEAKYEEQLDKLEDAHSTQHKRWELEAGRQEVQRWKRDVEQAKPNMGVVKVRSTLARVTVDEEEIIFEVIDSGEVKRLVREARDKDPEVRRRAVNSLAAHRNQPEVLAALMSLTKGMTWQPMSRLPRWIPLSWVYVTAFLFWRKTIFNLLPAFIQNWLAPVISFVSVRWLEFVKWFAFVKSLQVARWLGKFGAFVGRFLVAHPWFQWPSVIVFWVLLFSWPWIIGRILRGNRRKKEMTEVVNTAVKALQSWKGHVSRSTLWRIGRLAQERIGESDKTLGRLVQIWEEQTFGKS